MNDTTFCIDALSELFYKNLVETEDFSAHLDHCKSMGEFLIRAAFIKNLHTFDSELRSQVPGSWTLEDFRERTIITLFGAITYKRRIYRDEYGNFRHPLDEILGISTYQRLTPDAFSWIIYCVANVSYKKTAKAFEDKTGTKISRQTVMRCVHKTGELLENLRKKIVGTPISSPVLFLEVDGFWVDLQTTKKQKKAQARHTYKEQFFKKSMEMKVFCAYGGKVNHKRIGAIHWASNAKPDEFYAECIDFTATVYDTDDMDYLLVGADGASWCKNHGIDERMKDTTAVLSRLDIYHVNQRVYRAFSAEEDRSLYLNYLYKKDFAGFFEALDACLVREPQDERFEKRVELRRYIENNLDWLTQPSLSRVMRGRLLSELGSVFGDRDFYDHLYNLLTRRRYKRFLKDLWRIAMSCVERYRYDYSYFYEDAKEAVRLIHLYGPMTLGTMEGTNSKVYAARLKVWGCAWSERGALAMMRIRAAIASGIEIPTPKRGVWLTEKEKARKEKFNERGYGGISESVGYGYEAPAGHIVYAAKGTATQYASYYSY